MQQRITITFEYRAAILLQKVALAVEYRFALAVILVGIYLTLFGLYLLYLVEHGHSFNSRLGVFAGNSLACIH
jgi:CrcB protein